MKIRKHVLYENIIVIESDIRKYDVRRPCAFLCFISHPFKRISIEEAWKRKVEKKVNKIKNKRLKWLHYTGKLNVESSNIINHFFLKEGLSIVMTPPE